MTDEMVTKWGMQLGIPLVILFLMFIIWDLAKQSKAGRIGTFAMFLALSVGFLGYVIKVILQWQMEK
jgi:Na+/H+-dicarboxylate symporter